MKNFLQKKNRLERKTVPTVEGEKVLDPEGIPVYTQGDMKIQIFGEQVGNEDINEEGIYPEEGPQEDLPAMEEEKILPEESDDDSGNSSPPIPDGTAFFIFKKDNRFVFLAIMFFVDLIVGRFRIMCHSIQAHPVCANIILVCILVSSGFLACEDPLKANSKINVVGINCLVTVAKESHP